MNINSMVEKTIFEIFSTSRQSDLVPLHDLYGKLSVIYSENTFFKGDNAILETLDELVAHKYLVETNHKRIGRGPLYHDWELKMKPTSVPMQQINIGTVSGSGNNIGGTGDIDITISDSQATALVELVRELAKPKRPNGLLDKIKEALTSGKTALEILKMLMGWRT